MSQSDLVEALDHLRDELATLTEQISDVKNVTTQERLRRRWSMALMGFVVAGLATLGFVFEVDRRADDKAVVRLACEVRNDTRATIGLALVTVLDEFEIEASDELINRLELELPAEACRR